METEEALRKLIREKLNQMTPEQIKLLHAASKHVKAKHKVKPKKKASSS